MALNGDIVPFYPVFVYSGFTNPTPWELKFLNQFGDLKNQPNICVWMGKKKYEEISINTIALEKFINMNQ